MPRVSVENWSGEKESPPVWTQRRRNRWSQISDNTQGLPRSFQGKYFSSQILSGGEHLKPNQITRRCFPEVFAENYFSPQILSDGKSSSRTRKIAAVIAPPSHPQAFVVLTALFLQTVMWCWGESRSKKLKRMPITNVLFPPQLPRKTKLKSKPTSPAQPAISQFPFMGDQYHGMTSTDRRKCVPLLPLPDTGTNTSVSSLGKLSC